MLRVLLAFVVAPFPVAFVQSIIVAIWPKDSMGIFEHPSSMFVAICIYFYLAGLLLGIPAWLIVRKRRTMGLSAYAVVGLCAALMPVAAALIVMISRGQGSAYIIIYNVMLFGLGGLAGGALFSFITTSGKPMKADQRPNA